MARILGGGSSPLTSKRDLYVQLMRQGLSNSEARRRIGVNRKTGCRWRHGQTTYDKNSYYYRPIAAVVQEPSPRYLSQEERFAIPDGKRAGRSARSIASELGRTPSTSTVEPSTTAHPSAADRTFTATYDAAGLAVGAAEPGATVTRTFNELGALTSETGSGAGLTTASRTFTRDAAGRVLTASHPNGTINFAYNDKNQVTAATGAAGTSGFTYDVKGRMTGRTDAGTVLTAQAYSFSYTARDELQTAQDHLVANRTYAWRNDGLLNTVTQGNTRRDFTYDSIGRVASDTLKVAASNVTLNAATYGYDNDDNVTSRAVTAPGNPAAGTNTYTYDTAGRLATWTNPASTLTTYGYDNAGNRTTAGAQTFTYDERNRLTSGSGLTNVWSARGSLTSSTVSGVTTTYTADGLNRVTGVTRGATSLGFTYDSLDRPFQRTSNSVISNEFSYAGGESDPGDDRHRWWHTKKCVRPLAVRHAPLRWGHRRGESICRHRPSR